MSWGSVCVVTCNHHLPSPLLPSPPQSYLNLATPGSGTYDNPSTPSPYRVPESPGSSYSNPYTPGSGYYQGGDYGSVSSPASNLSAPHTPGGGSPYMPSPYRVPESPGSSYSNPYTPGSGYYQGGDYGSVSSPASNLSAPHTPGGGSPYMPSPLTPTSYDGQ